MLAFGSCILYSEPMTNTNGEILRVDLTVGSQVGFPCGTDHIFDTFVIAGPMDGSELDGTHFSTSHTVKLSQQSRSLDYSSSLPIPIVARPSESRAPCGILTDSPTHDGIHTFGLDELEDDLAWLQDDPSGLPRRRGLLFAGESELFIRALRTVRGAELQPLGHHLANFVMVAAILCRHEQARPPVASAPTDTE